MKNAQNRSVSLPKTVGFEMLGGRINVKRVTTQIGRQLFAEGGNLTAETYLYREEIMDKVVGIFHSAASAEQAVHELLNMGMAERSVIFLSEESPSLGTRATSGNELESASADISHSGDTGKKMGAIVGGTMGASAGLAAGATAAAAMLVPGLGMIFAIGMGAAAALGLGGAAVGAKVGDVAENSQDPGVDKENVAFYHDLLRQKKSVVIVNAETEESAAKARDTLKQHGSEDGATVRHGWRQAA